MILITGANGQLGTELRYLLDERIQLTDAILKMKNSGNKLYAYNFDGLRYDTGDKLGMFIANIEFGLRHPELKNKAKKYLKELVEKI